MEVPARVLVRVWDLPTRLFHWALAILVSASLVTGKFDSVLGAGALEWHRRSGYAILTLLLFRLAWGFVGGTYARFASFVRGPRLVMAHARGLLAGTAQVDSPGHNPLGGWSVIAMLAALFLQAATGLFLTQVDFGFEGPLAKYVSQAGSDRLAVIHGANFWLICTLVTLHVGAIVYYAVVKRQDLVGAMLSGRKRIAVQGGCDSRDGGILAGLLAFSAAVAIVWVIASLA